MRLVWLWLVVVVFAVSFAPGLTLAQSNTGSSAALWPHTTVVNGASVTVYQPQAISWPDHKVLTARAAVAITPPGTPDKTAPKPILGTIEVSLATTTDEASRMVLLSDPKLISTQFPALDTARAMALQDRIRAALPNMQITRVPLDSVLLSLGQAPAAASIAVNNDPPVIFRSERPASLVVFDGDPVLAPVGKTGLSFAVNTNWDVFTDGSTWYLLNNGLWLTAPAAAGPYKPVTKLPAAFNAIPNDANFAEVRKHIPAHPPQSAADVPTIFVSTKPAEIIVTVGPPHFETVAGTSLQAVTNTVSTLFRDPATQQVLLPRFRAMVFRLGP